MISKVFAVALSVILAVTMARPVREESEMLLPFSERLPAHGNWCGPGKIPSPTTGCIDDLDCKCKVHKLCWKANGMINCKCDNELVASLEGDTSSTGSAIRTYFARSPCLAPVTLKVPKTCKTCVKILNEKICTPYPCGTTTKCTMLIVSANKIKVSKHAC